MERTKDLQRELERDLLTAKEAAAYLRMSPGWGYQTLQKLVPEGKIRAGIVGDHYLFRKQDLDDFIFSKR